ncbi:MAG: LruC domain-containing protein [Bacteroidales bacterium]
MKSLRLFIIGLVIAGLGITSCQKDINNDNPPVGSSKRMSDLVIPADFDFNTAANIEISISSKTNDNSAVPFVPFTLLTAPEEEGGKLILKGVTNQNGTFATVHPLPSALNEVVLATTYPGMQDYQYVSVVNQRIDGTMGGRNEYKSGASVVPFKSVDVVLQPMGNYTTEGVPEYLTVPGDVIDPGLLALVNTNLPELVALPSTHPEWILPDRNYDIELIEDCDVWITFIDEGAGFKNTLGYYTYDMANPPASKDDIETIHIIYPNVSKPGFGGGLEAGDKVYLGQYEAGTGIGIVLLANGWNAVTQSVSLGQYQIYSNPDFNPQVGGQYAQYKQQFVMLYDEFRDIVLIGIEDLLRPNGDQDFNDAVFYLTVNPITAIDPEPYPDPEPIEDEDGDGVPDDVDDYPTDPDRAFDVYYPAEGEFGTLAFEDLWPSKGDYDFNDMIVDYNVKHVTNAGNAVVDVYGTYKLRAMGAHYKNGFGFQLETTPDMISQIEVTYEGEAPVQLNPEAGQTKAVLILWNNGFELLPAQGGGATGVNTTLGIPPVDEVTVEFSFTTFPGNPVPLADFGIPPYNPFMFINEDRGKEVHLRDHEPTDLVEASYFGTYDDASEPGNGIYYKTSTNLPWAIHLIESFDYPGEKIEIIATYNHFAEWAESGGAVYSDWYKDLPGYRVDENIYP